jgi:hypothetical protein
LPPPYAYLVAIEIESNGAGTFKLKPVADGSAESVPEWTGTFTATPEQLDALYAQARSSGLLVRTPTPDNDTPAGGSFGSIIFTERGRLITLKLNEGAANQKMFAHFSMPCVRWVQEPKRR